MVGWSDPGEVVEPIHPQQHGQIGVGNAFYQVRGPAEDRRGQTQRGQGVARVVLTVAVGPFAVFPGLPPVDRGQADKERTLGKYDGQLRCFSARQGAAALQAVVPADVVIDPGFNAR